MKVINLSKKKDNPTKSFFTKFKTKFQIFKIKMSETSDKNKLLILFLSLIILATTSVSIIYGYIIFTTPEKILINSEYSLIQPKSYVSASQIKFNYLHPINLPDKVKDQENILNGELFTIEDFNEFKDRKALAVMIENSVDARPQYGLSKADIVYETTAEAGITRFLAIFWSHDAEKVMPIRSTRTYYLDLLSEYNDPPLANIGQAGYDAGEAVVVPEADARSYMYKYNIKSYDRYGRKVYFRDMDRYNQGIAWEHVAYSDTKTLWDDAQIMGWTGTPDITKWTFKKDAPINKRPSSFVAEIQFMGLGGTNYNVKWEYDSKTNSYFRTLAGNPHIDAINDKQISAKNVIIQYTNYRLTGDRSGRLVINVIGEGDVEILQDGQIIKGTWKKESRTERTQFFDKSGNPIELNRGKIWVEIVLRSNGKNISTVTYK